MIKICVEGWRGINHSYAMVNQRQLIELSKYPIELKHKDISFFNKNWNEKQNSNGFSIEDNNLINGIKIPEKDEIFDITYRITFPYNFEQTTSKKLFIFGTSEYQNIDGHYINGDPKKENKRENFFIITSSNWSKEGFIKAGFEPSKVKVVPCGVESNIFKIIDDDRKKQIREKLGIKKEDFVISNIGAMTENKGIDYLLAAFAIIRKKKKNIKMILKDQSNLYNVKAENYLKKLKDSKYGPLINEDVINNIFFISKNMDLSTLNELYNITDCYVSPYRAEGFNLTPLEAAASGTPIIVTKGGSTDDYFNPKFGLQIDSKIINDGNLTSLRPNIESIVECILLIMKNPKDYGGLEVSKFIEKNFTWYCSVKKLYNILINKNV